jgi:nicotinate-nucleotide adenylyltransferase
MRIGIFGGTFNPPHMGHINSLITVQKKAGLDRIHVIPAALNPLKMQVEGPNPEQRLEMTKLAVASYGPQFVVDDQEIKRGGTSYTIDTINSLRKTVSADDLYLIVGMDKLDELSQWKKATEIIKEANLIVTSRPGFNFPDSEDELPDFIKEQVADFDFNFIELKTGRNIQFLKLQDVEVSGTDLRKWLRTGKSVEKYLPLSVESYVRDQRLYRHLSDKIGDFKKFTEFCANVLFSKKGIQVRAFDLRDMAAPSEFTLITSGTSTRHAASLGENLIQAVREEYGVRPQSAEGFDEGRWVVVDYGPLMVHVFYDFVRQEYALEKLWKEAKDMNLKDPALNK